MLVSIGNLSWWRTSRLGKISLNGSFVDFSFERQGQKIFISVLFNDLMEFVNGEQKSDELSFLFDEAANHRTAADEFQNHLKYLSRSAT